MNTQELLKKIRKIEIKTKGLSSQVFSGEYHSAFKGRGMAFSEVREYSPGDDIRTIDWNVTARFNAPYVKVFEEERELTVMLLVDISASTQFGSTEQIKRDFITELSAVLAFSAIQNNDKVGAILFSDQIEKFIPPKKGKSHILRIISELLNTEAKSNKTDVAQAVRYLSNVIKRRTIAFVISDFIDSNYNSEAFKISARRHDLVALAVSDPADEQLPHLGFVQIRDLETQQRKWIFANKQSRKQFHITYRERQDAWQLLFRKSGIDFVHLHTNASYVKPLMQLFKSRNK